MEKKGGTPTHGDQASDPIWQQQISPPKFPNHQPNQQQHNPFPMGPGGFPMGMMGMMGQQGGGGGGNAVGLQEMMMMAASAQQFQYHQEQFIPFTQQQGGQQQFNNNGNFNNDPLLVGGFLPPHPNQFLPNQQQPYPPFFPPGMGGPPQLPFPFPLHTDQQGAAGAAASYQASLAAKQRREQRRREWSNLPPPKGLKETMERYFQLYENWVVENAPTVSSIESSLNGLIFLLPASTGVSSTLTELSKFFSFLLFLFSLSFKASRL
jgi:hypothetical protein